MRKFVKASAAALALVLLLGACNKSGKQSGTEGSKEAVYTYNDYVSSAPNTWNPHTAQTNMDSYFDEYLQTPFVSPIPHGDGDYKWDYQAATSIQDVTESYSEKENWGIPGNAKKGHVWKITLRDDLTWSDGEKITADSYVYSMKQMLDPEMKNRRANTYYDGKFSIVGADKYFNFDSDFDGKTNYSPWVEELNLDEDTKLYFIVDDSSEVYVRENGFLGESIKSAYEKYPELFSVGGVDIYEKYKGKGLVEVTPEVQVDLENLMLNFDFPSEEWKQLTHYEDGINEKNWDKVGLFKGADENELYYISSQAISEFDFILNINGSWLVKEDLYEAGKAKKEGLIATNYATDLATTYSYGPYKLVSFEKDRQMKFDRNENWYGYKLDTDQYKDQFIATNINIDIVEDPNTALQLFNKGKLDNVNLDNDQYQRYRMSEYMREQDSSGVARFVFGTSPETLEKLEANSSDGSNKRVLQYVEFRKAISLSLDRNRITTESTPGSSPAYYLINETYLYDAEHDKDSIYRKSESAMEAIVELYGVDYGEGKTYATVADAYNALSGYDVESAKRLFQAAYDKAVAEGNYNEGQAVNINIMVGASSSLTAAQTRQQDIINELLKDATEGTGFAGKVQVKYLTGSNTRYEDVVNGKIEAILGGWTGGIYNPYSTIGVYVNPNVVGGVSRIHESNGWNPTREKLTLKYDFNKDGIEEEQVRTLTDWQKAITGIEFLDNVEARLYILSQLEKTILGTVQNIPLYNMHFNKLNSQKVSDYTDVYNPMYGWGGFRFFKFNYTDADWAKYVEDQGGILNYE